VLFLLFNSFQIVEFQFSSLINLIYFCKIFNKGAQKRLEFGGGYGSISGKLVLALNEWKSKLST